jgi:predicted ATPase
MHKQLLGNDGQDLASVVLTARRTDPVRLMRFAAVGTRLRRNQGLFMGPLADTNPAFRRFSFRYRHCVSPPRSARKRADREWLVEFLIYDF